MNGSIQDLTDALQELATREDRGDGVHQVLPTMLAPDDLKFSNEVQTFLDARRNYVAQTRLISIGVY